ncbi:hypothetical protein WMY93_022398 [Mugilogobius chulae]|uniref:Uncharacterized protein n=1 Tax=Mugilogobius chulae TaxID=88201 RepID=A0AAW0NJ89_9GOBI
MPALVCTAYPYKPREASESHNWARRQWRPEKRYVCDSRRTRDLGMDLPPARQGRSRKRYVNIKLVGVEKSSSETSARSPGSVLGPVGVRCRSSSASSSTDLHVDTATSETEKLKTIDDLPGPRMSKTLYWILCKGYADKAHLMQDLQKNLYGPIWRSRFGHYNLVNVASAELISQVIRQEGRYPVRALLPHWKEYKDLRGQAYGLHVDTGPNWYRIRSALNPKMLKLQEVRPYVSVILQVVDDLLRRIELLREKSPDKTTVPDIASEFYKFGFEEAQNKSSKASLGVYQSNEIERFHVTSANRKSAMLAICGRCHNTSMAFTKPNNRLTSSFSAGTSHDETVNLEENDPVFLQVSSLWPQTKSESKRDKSESKRDKSESKRDKSESKRDKSESKRDKSESKRDKSSQREQVVRDKSESKRDKSESKRQRDKSSQRETSPSQRDKSESKRDKSESRETSLSQRDKSSQRRDKSSQRETSLSQRETSLSQRDKSESKRDKSESKRDKSESKRDSLSQRETSPESKRDKSSQRRRRVKEEV